MEDSCNSGVDTGFLNSMPTLEQYKAHGGNMDAAIAAGRVRGNGGWVVTDRPPKEKGYYWITLFRNGEYWAQKSGWISGKGGECWPANAVAYMKIEEPKPWKP